MSLKGNAMALGWLTVLKAVPWGDVIENAPKVANGARRLWDAVGRKRPPAGAGDASPNSATDDPVLSLEERVNALEVAARDVHSQMLESSNLISELAEQNAQLIKRVESHRVRVKWLTIGVAALSAIILVIAIVVSSMQSMPPTP